MQKKVTSFLILLVMLVVSALSIPMVSAASADVIQYLSGGNARATAKAQTLSTTAGLPIKATGSVHTAAGLMVTCGPSGTNGSSGALARGVYFVSASSATPVYIKESLGAAAQFGTGTGRPVMSGAGAHFYVDGTTTDRINCATTVANIAFISLDSSF